jgi:excisionase family DNA binding protein
MPVHEATDYGVGETDATSRLLRVNDVAHLLAVSRDTVYRLVRTGDIVPLKVGSRLRFRVSDVEEYLARNTTASP